MTLKTLFLDIGGVILTNGWDTAGRKLAAKTFNLDFDEMEKRHRLTFDTYELGKMTLHDYVDWIVFYEQRPFSREDFEEFMFDYSDAHPEMIELFTKLKEKYKLRIGTISNEGRELTLYRSKTFNLPAFIDFFVVSSFVHLKKPDEEIYRMALDIGQTPLENVLYIDDRQLLVDAGMKYGIPSYRHETYEKTKAHLASLGLIL